MKQKLDRRGFGKRVNDACFDLKPYLNCFIWKFRVPGQRSFCAPKHHYVASLFMAIICLVDVPIVCFVVDTNESDSIDRTS
jgi:hypothetical protein